MSNLTQIILNLNVEGGVLIGANYGDDTGRVTKSRNIITVSNADALQEVAELLASTVTVAANDTATTIEGATANG